jgi:hypothetical protein
MSTYRFCGSFTEVGDLRLEKFGQAAEFSDALASDAILGGGCIIPSADFDKIAFTEQELSLYSNPSSHGDANQAFQNKKKRAVMVCHDLRVRLQAGEPLKPVSSVSSVSVPAAPATLLAA